MENIRKSSRSRKTREKLDNTQIKLARRANHRQEHCQQLKVQVGQLDNSHELTQHPNEDLSLFSSRPTLSTENGRSKSQNTCSVSLLVFNNSRDHLRRLSEQSAEYQSIKHRNSSGVIKAKANSPKLISDSPALLQRLRNATNIAQGRCKGDLYDGLSLLQKKT